MLGTNVRVKEVALGSRAFGVGEGSRALPHEMPPGGGIILAETVVLAGVRFRQ